jgi:hypothetical protein
MKNLILDYWQERQKPSWYNEPLKYQVSIDAVVNYNNNSHKPDPKTRQRRCDLHNALGLLGMVRKNNADPYQVGPVESLRSYMLSYRQEDGRRRYYKRWASKLTQQGVPFQFEKDMRK